MSGLDPPIVTFYSDFYGESFDPDEITQRLGFQPTSQFRRGEPMPPFSGRRRRDGWMVQVGSEWTFHIDDLVGQTMRAITIPPEEIRQLTSDLDVEAVITCEVQTDSCSMPSMRFPDEFIHWASAMGAVIDVDIMVLAEDEEKED